MRVKKLAALSVLLTPVALLGSGCVDNRATLFIDHVAGFEPDSECEVTLGIGTTEVFISQGSYDPQVPFPYIAPLVVGNQLVPLGDNDTLRPETSRIQLEGAEVRMEAPAGGSAIPAFTTYFSGTIHPESSTDPGLIWVNVPVIPGDADLDDGIYRLTIRVFGTTLGGTEIESGDFVFPVQVINGLYTTNCDGIDNVVPHPCGFVQDGYNWPCDSRPLGGGCPSNCN